MELFTSCWAFAFLLLHLDLLMTEWAVDYFNYTWTTIILMVVDDISAFEELVGISNDFVS